MTERTTARDRRMLGGGTQSDTTQSDTTGAPAQSDQANADQLNTSPGQASEPGGSQSETRGNQPSRNESGNTGATASGSANDGSGNGLDALLPGLSQIGAHGPVDGLINAADNLVADAAHTADNVIADAVNAGDGLIGAAAHAATGLVPDGVHTADDLVGHALSGSNALLGDAMSTVNGLAGHGLTGANGLIGDVAHAAGGVAGNAVNGVNGLIADVVNAADHLLNTAGVGNAAGNIVHDALADATGPFTAGVLASSGGGHGPFAALDLTDNGGVGKVVDDLGSVAANDPAATGLTSGRGALADASLLQNGSGSGSVADLTVNNPSQPGPLIDVSAAGNGHAAGSHNLINADAGPQSAPAGAMADIFAPPDASSNSAVAANVIDVGPNGPTLANANVATAPDQFHFPTLNGTGSDALVGALSNDATAAAHNAGIPAVTAPIVDIGGHGPLDAGLTGQTDATHQTIVNSTVNDHSHALV
jgi:hypothetical protein